MSNKKDIYWQGKIYQGCEKPFPEDTLDGVSYKLVLHDFKLHLLDLISYALIGSHNFKEGQQVVEGKDYEIGYQWQTEFKGRGKRWEDCTQAVYSMAHVAHRCTVAVPLQEQPSSQVSDRTAEEMRDVLAEKYAFQVPYNGTNDFYDEKKLKAFQDGFDAALKYRNQPTPPEGKGYSLEDMEKAFDAGYKHGWGQSEFEGEGESVTTTKKQFLASLPPQAVKDDSKGI